MRAAPDWNSGSRERSASAAATAGSVGREVVIPHEDVQTGRVPPAHLHAIDRRQRLLDRQVSGQRGGAGVPTGELGDRPYGAQAVPTQRPQDIAQLDGASVRLLETVDVVDVGLLGNRRQLGVDLVGVRVQLVQPGGDPGDQLMAVDQREDTRDAAQQRVDGAKDRRDGCRSRGASGERLVERAEQVAGKWDRPRWRSAEDADDAAHGRPGY